jgi:hypothetical protein
MSFVFIEIITFVPSKIILSKGKITNLESKVHGLVGKASGAGREIRLEAARPPPDRGLSHLPLQGGETAPPTPPMP